MKIKWKTLIACIAIPLLCGGLATLISSDGMKIFDTLNKPALSPPGWLFPVAWTVLYTLMGISSYLILKSDASQKEKEDSLKIYGIQLFFNFLWTVLFFNFKLYWLSFVWLVILWILILITIISFYKISKSASYLLIPYLLWVAFAGYLNLATAMLN